ncbi:MAG: polyamine aminopropyltransferase [Eubacteriales bacterium]|nr:polyamine aminopropyltransferase [Eubacteriales bacterium]
MNQLWYTEQHTGGAGFSFKVEEQLCSRRSEYQLIEVFKTLEFGNVLVMDGCIMLSEKDEFIYHEMLVHVPLAVHPKLRRVLVVGGGDGGILTELIRYPELESIDLVEIDREVVEVSKLYFPSLAQGFDDPRVTVYYDDGLRFVRQSEASYDLIIVDSTDPFGPGESLFTKEFYGNCMARLNSDGILVNQHESPYYRENAREVSLIYSKTSAIFPLARCYQAHIPMYPSGHWLFGFLSLKYDPIKDHDPERWEARGLSTRYYNSELHRGCFALPNYVLDLFNAALDED